MSKIALPLAGIGGLGASSVGGYFLLRDKGSEAPVSKEEATFKSKYSLAILEEGSELWNSKFDAFKQGSKPTHPTLREAKSKVTPKEQDAKDLHKRGCQEIYESKLSDSPYFQDFKSYCSKTLKDGMGNSKNWISVGKEDSSKWNPKLNSLKTHRVENNHTLDGTLKNLKDSLTGADSSWDNDKREVLKNWCDDTQKEIFMGETDPKFVQAGLYCVE